MMPSSKRTPPPAMLAEHAGVQGRRRQAETI